MRHDEFGYHFHASPIDAPYAERMAVEAAMSMSDVSAPTNSAGCGSAACPTATAC